MRKFNQPTYRLAKTVFNIAFGSLMILWPLQTTADPTASTSNYQNGEFQIAQAPGGQTPPRGRVRIQGKETEKKLDAPIPILTVTDHREAMRQFIQSISAYARRQNRNFMVLTKDGLDLLVKKDINDDKISLPARTYMRSIDGVVIDGLFYGRQSFGLPTDKKVLETRLPLVGQAVNNGIKTFVIDYVKSPQEAQESIKLNNARNLIPFPANTPRHLLNTIPPYPRQPIQENPKSILSIRDVKNFLYLRETSKFGRQDEFTLNIHGTNYDLVIVDVFHGRSPLSKRAVETLKFKKIGARRLVFAHIDIGTAASYRYYWKARWREGSPFWIKAPVPGEPDRYFVQFWQPEWRRIITGDAKSYVFGAIRQGFDGIVLEGINAYRFFEGTSSEAGSKLGSGGGPL
ncbi:MAG: hypothetical protein ACO3MW_04015 [Rhodospirillales bacterium]